MDRDTQGRWLTGLGIAAALVGLVVFLKKRGGGHGHGSEEHRAYITVLENGMDVRYSPETIPGVSRGNGDKVVWEVENESSRRVEVCVKRFRNETTGADEDPLEDIEGGGKCRRVHGGSDRKILTRVKGAARLGTYKYSIFVDGREAVDPRLSIVD